MRETVVAEIPCPSCDGTGWNVRIQIAGKEYVLSVPAARFRETLLSWRNPNHPSRLGAEFQSDLFAAASQVAHAAGRRASEAIFMADQLGQLLYTHAVHNTFDETPCRTCGGLKYQMRIVDTGVRLPLDDEEPEVLQAQQEPEPKVEAPEFALFLVFPPEDADDPLEWALEASEELGFAYESQPRVDSMGLGTCLVAWAPDGDVEALAGRLAGRAVYEVISAPLSDLAAEVERLKKVEQETE